jgi:hypothetical protein
MSVVAAALIPWHPAWQAASVVLIAATAIWTVATVMPSPHLFWLQNVGAITPTLAATVAISYVLRRQRAAVAHAEREWRTREESLREANRRLEHEINEHRRTEDALRFAMRELDHRVKNTLATVQSVARSDSARVAIHDRVWCRLLRAHPGDGTHPHGAGRPALGRAVSDRSHRARRRTIPAPHRQRFRRLRRNIHLLGTGAGTRHYVARAGYERAKYGALSSDEGRLAISSHVESRATPLLRIFWNEDGGPPVGEPALRGVGVRLIEEALAYECDGHVHLQFRREGSAAKLRFPCNTNRDYHRRDGHRADKWTEAGVLAVIVAVGAYLRLESLSARALWSDERYTSR